MLHLRSWTPANMIIYRHFYRASDIYSMLHITHFQMSSITFQHKQFYGGQEHLEAMRWLKEAVKAENFDGIAFAMAHPYSRWEIDEVIGWELQRNLVIAVFCVFLTTFILIADFRSCILVLSTVLLNLVSLR